MKKSSKVFAIALLTFFASLANTQARQMTVEELGNLAYSEHQDTNYIYVIGEYAFTSEHTLTTQDIMLASRSISMNNEFDGTNQSAALAEMNITQIVPTLDSDWEVSGWEIDDNIVGKTKLEKNKKYNIRYIDYKFEPEVSKADINFELDQTKHEKYIQTLKDALKFESEKFYGKNENNEKKLTYKDGKLTGILIKNNGVSLNEKDQEKNGQYFFALVVEVPNATDNVTVKMKNLNGEFTSKKEDFDVKPGENKGTPGIVILVPIDPADFAKKENQTMTLTIDADGEESKEYEPTEYTIDISGLILQGASTFTVGLENISDEDKKIITQDWGYDETLNKGLSLTNGELTGTLVEQELTSDKVYGADKRKGYFYYFTFVLPNGSDKNKVKIEEVNDENGTKVLKEFIPDEFDDNNNLTLFPRIAPETKCEEGKNCKMYFRIDLDGDGDKYYPTIYTLDYSKVTLEKNSFFTVTGMEDSEKDKFNDKTQDNKWYDTENGYSVEVTQDETDAHKYKVSGILPIFDDSGYTDPFDPEEILYYLGLKLTLEADSKISTDGEESIVVKFFHGDEQEDKKFLKVDASDFESSNDLYILKALSPTDEREFTITVDLDGDGDEYVPYTVTIDWSELTLQAESVGNFGNYEVMTESDLTEGSQEKTDLTKYSFDFNADKEVTVETVSDPENGEVKKGLKGSIKEQTLNDGTFDNDTGFFVPIKIEFPGTGKDELSDYSDKWTIILNTEKNEKKTYTPTTEEYKQGWVLVLFRIDDQKDDKYIRYEIDFDGAGFEFVPQEYTISYQDLEFLNAHKVSIKGNEEKTITVYDKDQITDEILEELAPETNDKYHELDKFVTDDGEEFVGKTITSDDEDFEIIAHWNINADAFVDDVIKDLNSTDTTNSNDFSDKFTVSRDGDDITITLKQPNIPLTDLAETSIPGAIAYILGQDEITTVKLTVGGQTVEYNKDYKATGDKSYTDNSKRTLLDETGKALKTEIIEGAKDAFDKELDNHEADATLDQLEFDNKTFTIKIEKTVDYVSIVGDEGTAETDKTYTFKFDSDFAVVDQDDNLGAQDLSEAISNSNNYNTIYIDGDYNASDIIEISKDVTIAPVANASAINAIAENPTKVSVTGKDYVFDVKGGNVTISDLELSGAKKAELYVEDGANVTVNTITIDAEKDKVDEGVLVSATGKINVNGITFKNETHDTPTIRAEKNASDKKGIVIGKGLTSQYNPIIDVVHHDEPWCMGDPSKTGDQLGDCSEVSYSDEMKSTEGATFYYVDPSHVVEYYVIGFMNNDVIKAGMYRVFKKGETDKPIDLLEKHKTTSKGDKTLYFVGYGYTRGDSKNYADVVKDWSQYHIEESGKWFIAMYVEKDHTITVDTSLNTQGLDAYKGKEYKTYKFNDKTNGMTIGELKTIDPEFKKMWDALDAAKGPNQIMIKEQVATDETVINEDVTITLAVHMEG